VTKRKLKRTSTTQHIIISILQTKSSSSSFQNENHHMCLFKIKNLMHSNIVGSSN